jgi:hypothetical protein
LVTNDNKIFRNVKTKWISMLNLNKKIDGKIKNILIEDDTRQPYKPTSKYELWTFRVETFVFKVLNANDLDNQQDTFKLTNETKCSNMHSSTFWHQTFDQNVVSMLASEVLVCKYKY